VGLSMGLFKHPGPKQRTSFNNSKDNILLKSYFIE